MITFKRLTGAIGADVHGIDLSQSLSGDQVKTIHDGLLEHLVLFFREQKILSAEQHMALAQNFGDPEPTPFRRKDRDEPTDILILDQTDPAGSEAAHFHADNTFRPEPPIGAILQAHIIPARGGDTVFASMYAAYE